MRLNIGCGKKRKKGYVNLDIRPLPGVNIVADVAHLPFKESSIEEIFAESVLEHCSRIKVVSILEDWIKILEPKGSIHIICPNLRLLAEKYLTGVLTTEKYVRQIYGDQGYLENTHYCGFDPCYLVGLLKKLGVQYVELIDEQLNNNNLYIVGHK